jgi:2-polyprenyl-3-methyl-5-hydroxy-6-metoxy-1,4-benzoquinol methylase
MKPNNITSPTEDSWSELLKSFAIPTYVKKFISEPFLSKQEYLEPVLDAGCGTGYFSNLLYNDGHLIVSVDKNLTNKHIGSCRSFKSDLASFKPKNTLIGDVLLINVLSCIDSPTKRAQILQNLKMIKNPKGKVYVINMSEDIICDNFKSSVMRVSKISDQKAELAFKKIDGTEISFSDNMICENEFEKQCKDAGLKIITKEYLKYKKEKFNIYTLYILQ